MLHGMAIAHIHVHHVVVELASLNNAMLDHHHHFLLMGFVHFRGADVEFVHQVTFVLDHKAHRFAGLHFDRFRLVVVVVHFHRDCSTGF